MRGCDGVCGSGKAPGCNGACGAPPCADCLPGYYRDAAGTGCTACPAGKTSPAGSLGPEYCACMPGYNSDDFGADTCSPPCPDKCALCGRDNACVVCHANYYMVPECLPCPDGTTSPPGSQHVADCCGSDAPPGCDGVCGTPPCA